MRERGDEREREVGRPTQTDKERERQSMCSDLFVDNAAPSSSLLLGLRLLSGRLVLAISALEVTSKLTR